MLFAKSHLFNCPPSKKDVAEYGSEPFEAKKLNAPGLGWMLTRSHLNQIGTKDFFCKTFFRAQSGPLFFKKTSLFGLGVKNRGGVCLGLGLKAWP